MYENNLIRDRIHDQTHDQVNDLEHHVCKTMYTPRSMRIRIPTCRQNLTLLTNMPRLSPENIPPITPLVWIKSLWRWIMPYHNCQKPGKSLIEKTDIRAIKEKTIPTNTECYVRVRILLTLSEMIGRGTQTCKGHLTPTLYELETLNQLLPPFHTTNNHTLCAKEWTNLNNILNIPPNSHYKIRSTVCTSLPHY